MLKKGKEKVYLVGAIVLIRKLISQNIIIIIITTNITNLYFDIVQIIFSQLYLNIVIYINYLLFAIGNSRIGIDNIYSGEDSSNIITKAEKQINLEIGIIK